MMRAGTVLHVLEAFAGGTERHLLDLVRHVEGYDHVLAVPSRHHGRSTAGAVRRAELAGARVEIVEMGRAGAGAPNLAALVRLRRLIDRLAPDLVHGHSSIGGALARVAAAPVEVPVLYTPHGLSRSRWALGVERLLGGRAERLIAVSASERNFALRHGIARAERIVVIPNGLELRPPAPPVRGLRERLGIPDGVPLVGCCARLAWQKAPEVYVAAAALAARELPAAHFVLVGSGPLRQAVERAIARAGLAPRFHLLSGLDDAAASMGELDAYVLPSRFEGGPYTPLEAMRAGVPVVVTDVDGNRDTVAHGRSGLIVPAEDPTALAHAMIAVLRDAALSERLVRGAREELPRFDVRRMARMTARVYAELLAGRGLGAGEVDLRVRTRAGGPREQASALDPSLR